MTATRREARRFFTEKEQTALARTEAVTLIADGGVPDEVFGRAAAHFDEEELARLLGLILAIDTWNASPLATGKIAGADERR